MARKLGVPVISVDALIQMPAEPSAVAKTEPLPPLLPTPSHQPLPRQTRTMPSKTSASKTVPQTDSRRFEFVDAKSSKFWEIRQTDHEVTVRYGKIGTEGQTMTKPFDDAPAAAKHAEKLVSEKLKGGYAEVGAPPVAPATQADKPTKPTPKVPAPDGGASSKGISVPTPSPAPAPAKPAAKPAAKAADAVDASRTLCISGKLPSGRKKADYEAPLRAVGIELVDDVIKGLAYLVLADPASTSTKSEKARKMGVEVISEEQLQALIPTASKGPA